MAKPSKDNFQERIKALAFYGTTNNKVNESNNQNATLIEYVRTDDGTAYGIVKENHDYYIKKSNRKGDLNSTDFAYIGGLENKNNYKYGGLAEGQKNLNFVIKSINEAYSLGGVYNKLDESTTQKTNESVDDKPENINDFLSSRIKNGKKSLTEDKEKKFKASLNQKVEASTNKKGLMSEEAKSAIHRALGMVNEEALSTKDSEQKDGDDINDQNDIEKGQSAALNQDGEKNQKDADKAMAKGKQAIEKTDQKGAISVDETVKIENTAKQSVYTDKPTTDSMITKDSEIDPSVYNKPSKDFGNASYGGEKVKSTADSEIEDADMIANQDGKKKEKAESPVTDENAKSKADAGLKTPKAPSTEDSEMGDKGLATASGTKEKPQAPVNDSNAKKKADSKVNEGEELTTADSEVEMSQSLPNKKDSKENAQAPINDTNAKAEAEKRNASGGKSQVTPDETSDDEDIVAEPVNEGEEDDPFKEKSKNEKDMSTDDSDQEDGDRVDNKDKHEKVDSYNSHYDPEMAHKEQKGEELKVKKEKAAIVAEAEQKLKEGMSDIDLEPIKKLIQNLTDKIRSGASSDPQKDKQHADYLQSLVQDMEGQQMNEDDISTSDSEIEKSDMLAAEGEDLSTSDSEIEKSDMLASEGVNEVDAGDDETDAAAAAMDDLEIDVENQDDAQEAQPEMGGGEMPDMSNQDGGGEPQPEMGGEDDVDLDVNVDAENPEGEEEGEPYREVKKKIADIAQIVNDNEFEDDKIKDFINSYLSEFEPDIANMEVVDRKDMADEILKAKPDAEGGESEASGLEKGSEDAIDQQMANLDQGNGEEEVDVDVDVPVEEQEQSGGSFEQYVESRGYGLEELQECGNEEMANIIAGYRNDGGDDAKGVAVYIKDPAVVSELGDYGHADFGQALEPFIGSVGEGNMESHRVEPMPQPIDEPIGEDDMEASDALDAAVDHIDNGELDGSADASDLDQLDKQQKKKAFNSVEDMTETHEDDNSLIGAIQNAIQIARESGDEEMAKRLEQQLAMANTDVAEKEEIGFAKTGQVMGGGVRKPMGAQLEYEDVEMSESEKKIRKYVQNKLAEMAGKKKPSINENKSSKLKAFDKMIEEHFNLYNRKK